jgi:hypothetical protein
LTARPTSESWAFFFRRKKSSWLVEHAGHCIMLVCSVTLI